MDYYAIGQRIRKIRKAKDLSQEQLAEKIGISNTHMSHIETGNTKLSLPVLVAISSVLDTRTDELLFDVPQSIHPASSENINRILSSCSSKQIRIIEDVVVSLYSALKSQE